MSEIHFKYMQRCIQLAQKGLGKVSPNPMVGSVIVYDGKIIGEGFHQKYGENHAEVNAINSVKDRGILKKSTIYVSLEPCSHHGKTPPCADMIIKSGIQDVVIGSIDPNPKVAGKGVEKLNNAGLNVITRIEEKKCHQLNRRFYTFHKKKRPYIIFKWAQSKDGFIDLPRGAENNTNAQWITNEFCRKLVHKWRTEEDAFLVGTNTAIKDNPNLTARNWDGRNPIRIVIDKKLKIPETYNIFNNQAKTLIFNEITDKNSHNTIFIKQYFDKNLVFKILKTLYENNIQSVVIEGGTSTINEFIKCNLWDEARIFTGKDVFNKGVKAPDFDFPISESFKYEDSVLNMYKNSDNEFN